MLTQDNPSRRNGWFARSVVGVALISSALVVSVVLPSHASGYTFVTLAVDFASFRDALFGCSATATNDVGIAVGGCNDQAENSEIRGFSYDGRRFAEVDFNHTKSANPEVQNVDPLFAKSSYQGNAFGRTTLSKKRLVVNGVTPQDINNQGEITGWFFAGKLRGFLKRNGRVLALDAPDSLYTEATGINDLSDIVGDYRGEDGFFHGFIYRNGTYATIDVPAASDTGANGVNNLGQIVGCYSLCSRGFLYDSQTSTFSAINVPGALTTQATDINDSGQIVGVYSTDNVTLHAFLYDAHGFSTIDAPGARITSAYGINNLGQIAGFYLVERSAGVFDHYAYLAKPN